MDNLPEVKEGYITPPKGDGLGIRFKPEIFQRADLVIKTSEL